MIKPCINCGENIDAKFCGFCGQKQLLTPLTKKQFVVELWDTLSLVNSPLKNTTIRLWRSPGEFVKQFALGRQVGFVSPVPFFIMILALYVILVPIVIDGASQNINLNINGGAAVNDEGITQFRERINEYVPPVLEAVKQAINFFYFLLPFCLSLCLPKISNEAKNGLLLSASFYYVAMSMIIAVPFLVLALFLPDLIGLRLLAALIYLSYAFNRFYQNLVSVSYFSVMVRVVLGYFIYMLCIVIILAVWIGVRAVIS